jgi:hypothetical protein
VFEAELVATGPAAAAESASAQIAVEAPPTSASPPQMVELTLDEVALAIAKDPPRRGSPFAMEATLVDRKPHETYYGSGPYREPTEDSAASQSRWTRPRPAQYPRNTSAVGGITAALVLAIISLFGLYFSVLGGITATIGLGCAIWGLFDQRRKGLAMAALLLCCLALMIAGWKLGFILYDRYQQSAAAAGAAAGLGP